MCKADGDSVSSKPATCQPVMIVVMKTKTFAQQHAASRSRGKHTHAHTHTHKRQHLSRGEEHHHHDDNTYSTHNKHLTLNLGEGTSTSSSVFTVATSLSKLNKPCNSLAWASSKLCKIEENHLGICAAHTHQTHSLVSLSHTLV